MKNKFKVITNTRVSAQEDGYMNFELPQTRTKYHQNTKLKNKDAISLQLIIYFRVEVEFNLYFNDLLTFDTNSKPKLVSLLEGVWKRAFLIGITFSADGITTY